MIPMNTETWNTLFGSLFPTAAEAFAVRGKFILGSFLIFLECLVCVGNAILTQYIFEENELQSPFIMSYFGISTMIIAIPFHIFTERRERRLARIEAREEASLESESFDSLADDLTRCYCFSDVKDVAVKRTMGLVNDHNRRWNHRKHFLAALLITPAMFLADWAFNAALLSTSVASATTLVSIQSVFVYILAVCLALDKFSTWKVVGILFGVAGIALTAIHDDKNDNAPEEYTYSDVFTYTYNSTLPDDFQFPQTNTWGDTLAVLAAVAYATYTVQVRLFCPENEELYSMHLLLGYIGALAFVPLLPVAIYLLISQQIRMSWSTFALVLVKGILDFLVTDYLLFRAIVLTGATVATVGAGMAIPIAFFGDVLMGRDDVVSWFSIVGALACSGGFLIVNLAPEPDDKEPKKETDECELSKKTPQLTTEDYVSL